MAKKTKKLGRLSIGEMRNLINKKAGSEVAFDLTKDNPTQVKDWISTGSRWLDSIICRGQLAGIPAGKIVEIAGLEGSGNLLGDNKLHIYPLVDGFSVGLRDLFEKKSRPHLTQVITTTYI